MGGSEEGSRSGEESEKGGRRCRGLREREKEGGQRARTERRADRAPFDSSLSFFFEPPRRKCVNNENKGGELGAAQDNEIRFGAISRSQRRNFSEREGDDVGEEGVSSPLLLPP